MGVEVINQSVQKAKKVYTDDGWEEINNWILYGMQTERGKKVSFADKRTLVSAKNNMPHKIQVGQLYERQFNKMDGQVYTWRTKKVFYDIIIKYDLFLDC